MEITKIIEIVGYRFELILKSRSTHAHSLMIDYKDRISEDLDAVERDLGYFVLAHKETKG